MPEPCWSCGTYNREKRIYEGQTGIEQVFCNPDEMLPDDVIEKTSESGNYVWLNRTQPCHSCNGSMFTHFQFLRNRNYDVFSILADVRNGYGFAGVKTSSGFTPIAGGRGLPDDLSEGIVSHLKRIGYDVIDGGLEYHRDGEEEDDLYDAMERERDGYWSLGEHSFTWVTLQEIYDFDWSKTTQKEGWVTPGEFQHFRDHGAPNSYCGGVSGSGVEHITASDMASRIDSGEIQFGEPDEYGHRPYTTGLQRGMKDWPLPEGSTGAAIRDRESLYCPVEWTETYAECVGSQFWLELELIREQAPDGDLSKVRLVMGFDS
jgi:hypothetical protein